MGSIAQQIRAEDQGFAGNIDLTTLMDKELTALKTAADDLAFCEAEFAEAGNTALLRLLDGVSELETDSMYPDDAVEDISTGSQYYFHAHADRGGEYGHFHTYVMANAIPDSLICLSPATRGEHQDPARTHCHLVALSVNGGGMVDGMFTINHWAAHEARYSVPVLGQILDRFSMEAPTSHALTSRWICALLKAFRPQIMTLFHEREMLLDTLDKSGGKIPACENEELEVTSSIKIDIAAQIAAINAEWIRRLDKTG